MEEIEIIIFYYKQNVNISSDLNEIESKRGKQFL